MAVSISVPHAEVLVILHDLVVHRNILLLRIKEARLPRIKVFHTTRDVVLFLRVRVCSSCKSAPGGGGSWGTARRSMMVLLMKNCQYLRS
jgi:hypothetical protein